jgi:hypothetical protein
MSCFKNQKAVNTLTYYLKGLAVDVSCFPAFLDGARLPARSGPDSEVGQSRSCSQGAPCAWRTWQIMVCCWQRQEKEVSRGWLSRLVSNRGTERVFDSTNVPLGSS